MGNSIAGQDQYRLLATLERLLEIEATEVRSALHEASDLVSEALDADKVDVFLYEDASDSLVAVGTSNTALGRRQHAIGMDRLPLANGGRTTEVYQSGQPYITRQADEDPGVLRGLVDGLGIRSMMLVALEIGGEIRGVLSATSIALDSFTDDDLTFLQAVARWIGALVHRAELVEHIARDSAEQARRSTAEELVTVLAHDLNNHFTPLKLRLDVMARRASQEHREADLVHLREATNGLARLQSLVGDLLDVGRLEQGIFTLSRLPLDIVVLARRTAEVLGTADQAVEVRAPESLILEADPDRMQQALENLVANAIRFSPRGVPVLIAIGEEARKDEQWAVVEIHDKGPGIPPEILPKLFARFSPGPGSSGLGLGLFIAKSIAEAHGGTLEVTSSVGTGTSFRLSLPI